jgi:peptidoglycan/xylan/chitin deacetylase (PgdA/CDA1 family)
VALTFDDGPDLFTEPILEILRAYDAKATFFVLGAKVAARPAQVRTATADGHQLGNHSWDHPHLADLGPEQVQAQLLDTQRAVVAAGAPAPTVFRPPFGSTSPAVEQQAEALGLRVRTWTFDTEDWRGRAPADIVHAVLEQLSPGSVILLHDGTRDASSTVKALPDLIEGIRARGFCTAPMK